MVVNTKPQAPSRLWEIGDTIGYSEALVVTYLYNGMVEDCRVYRNMALLQADPYWAPKIAEALEERGERQDPDTTPSQSNVDDMNFCSDGYADQHYFLVIVAHHRWA